MKFRHLALAAVLAVAGSAFAQQATETTVVRQTPHGTVTKHIVRVHPRRHYVKKIVIHRAPVVHRHYVYVPHHHRHYVYGPHHHRHYAYVHHDYVRRG
ncbi:MAG TPA: hypothetical protein VHA82_09470 [Ramlibacter sp.]|uniref:hypothetical protein n=1 Tax=Ramlibacter sp. TaxID=1917967 RepID=UPI002BCB3E90|nr:hypothetical protein [Ramlibacter sp.]HVZ44028.1 hypothetical protein [Ramlibacter sp.]